jgi:16S rRNA (cytosine967-C5)-methyltransferase
LKTNRDSLLSLLSEENVKCESIDGHDNAIAIEKTGKISDLKSFKNGLFYVQDISSQTAAGVLGALPGESMVDVCASPGGKSFYSALNMKNSGCIYSFDKNESKAKLVSEGAKRLSIKIIHTGVCDAQIGNSELFGSADRVLVDAPCSGLGIIGKKPDIRYKEKDEIEGLSDIQRNIIQKSSEYIKKDGVMVYSTCTLNRHENEEIAAWFLNSNPNFKPVEFEISVFGRNFQSENGMLTLLPHVHNTDGFFIFKTQKN